MQIQYPNLRTMAEAAYLVNPEGLTKGWQPTNTLRENYHGLINGNDYFTSLKEQGYECCDALDNQQDGFYAVALGNNHDELLVAIRGTDFWDRELGCNKISSTIVNSVVSGDLHSDLQIALGKLPKQYRSAETFVGGLLKRFTGNQITVVGHSLGGLLAQLVSARFGVEATVFDSPGAKKRIERLVGNNFEQNKILIINVLPNFINTCGEHVKIPLALNNGGELSLDVGCNFFGTMPRRSKAATKYLLSHGMEDMLTSISKDGVFESIPIKSWPRDGWSFYLSVAAYEAMPHLYDKYIYQLWRRQYEGNYLEKYAFPVSLVSLRQWQDRLFSFSPDFRTRYPTFEAYRSDFLQYGLVNNKEIF